MKFDTFKRGGAVRVLKHIRIKPRIQVSKPQVPEHSRMCLTAFLLDVLLEASANSCNQRQAL